MHIIWVSTSGSDSEGVGSMASPFQTISRAMDSFVSGDQIRLLDGTYTPTDSIMVSGVDGSIFAENPDSVFIQPQKTVSHQACLAIIDAERFTVQGIRILQAADSTGNNIGIYAENVENFICNTCAISNFEVPSGDAYGIYASGGGRVENCRVENFKAYGDFLYGIKTEGISVIDPELSEIEGGSDTYIYAVHVDGLRE